MVHSGMQTLSATPSHSAANTAGIGTSVPGPLEMWWLTARTVLSLSTSASWKLQHTSTWQRQDGRKTIVLSVGGSYSSRRMSLSTVLVIPTAGSGCAQNATKNS